LPYQLQDYQKEIKHAIGKPPDVQLVDSVALVNRALQRIVHAHPWAWRRRTMSLATTNASSSVGAVPADFFNVVTLHEGPTLASDGSSMLAEITPLFSRVPQKAHSTYRYTLETTPGATLAGPTYAIKLYPPAKATATIEGVYLRTIADLANPTDYPDIPVPFRPLLSRLVRAMALVEDDNPAGQIEMQDFLNALQFFKDQDSQWLSATDAGVKSAPQAPAT
jgi:hypothetical protein